MHLIRNLITAAEAIPLEQSSVWETHEKSFEMWICALVFSMIGHSNDVILRYICFTNFNGGILDLSND